MPIDLEFESYLELTAIGIIIFIAVVNFGVMILKSVQKILRYCKKRTYNKLVKAAMAARLLKE